jgi:hypothetical protein
MSNDARDRPASKVRRRGLSIVGGREVAAAPVRSYPVVLSRSFEPIWSGYFVCATDADAINEARKLLEGRAKQGEPELNVKVGRRGPPSSEWLGVWTWERHPVWRGVC